MWGTLSVRQVRCALVPRPSGPHCQRCSGSDLGKLACTVTVCLVIQACILHWNGCFQDFVLLCLGIRKRTKPNVFSHKVAPCVLCGEPCLCDRFGVRSCRARVVPTVSAARRSWTDCVHCDSVFGDPGLHLALEWLLPRFCPALFRRYRNRTKPYLFLHKVAPGVDAAT